MTRKPITVAFVFLIASQLHIDDVSAFVREIEGERIFVVLNFGAQPAAVNLPNDNKEGRLLLSSFCDRADERVAGAIDLRENEGVVIEL